jgi:hypothetical protein
MFKILDVIDPPLTLMRLIEILLILIVYMMHLSHYVWIVRSTAKKIITLIDILSKKKLS